MSVEWNQLIDNAEKIFRIVAVIVGVLWVYSHSVRDWIFGIPRLQLEVSASLLSVGENHFILVTMQVKNIGSSIVRVRALGTGLKVVSLQADSPVLEAANLIEKETTAFPVLEKKIAPEEKKWSKKFTQIIEPDTGVNEHKLLAVNANKYDAFRLELKVFAKGGAFLGWKKPDCRWTATAIAVKGDGLRAADQGR